MEVPKVAAAANGTGNGATSFSKASSTSNAYGNGDKGGAFTGMDSGVGDSTTGAGDFDRSSD